MLATRRPVGGRQRRKLVWSSSNATVARSVGAGQSLNDDLLSNLRVAGSSVLGGTVIRTHSWVYVRFLTADTGPSVFMGYLVDTAPTGTNLINAQTDQQLDWMLLEFRTPSSGDGGQRLDVGTTELITAYKHDLRSKRKMEELGERYFFCITNTGSNSITYSRFTRTLVALP